MKPISIVSISLWFILAAIAGYEYSSWAVNNGYAVPISPLSLTISVLVVAVSLFFLALPIYRYKRSLKKIREAKNSSSLSRPLPVDPFYAVRVLLLAKASAVTAALFIGWHGGVLVYLYLAPVVAQDAIAPNLSAGIVSIVLLVVAFVVQAICKLPNDASPGDDAVAA